MAGQSTTSSTSAPAWALPYWGSYLNGMSDLTQQPYQQYGGPRVADFSPEQYDAMGMISDRAHGGGPMTGDIQSALHSMLGGGMGGGMGGDGGASGFNLKLDKNPLLGEGSSMVDELIRRTGADTARDFSTGTAAQTDAMAARAGAFGGSAYNELANRNASTLADRLAGSANATRLQDLGQRRGLEEAALDRSLQGQIASGQIAAQRSSGARAAAASMANAQLAARNDAIRSAMDFNQSGYRDAHELMGVGNLRQMYSQGLLDSDYGNFREQRDHPYQMADMFGNAIARATGGQNTQTQTTNNQSNPWGTALGTGLGALALWNMYSGNGARP
jgi:hypothetical protein